MDAKQQKEFILELAKNVAADMIYKIDIGKIPETWDGYELRKLISERICFLEMDSEREKEYRNVVLNKRLHLWGG